MISSLRGTVLAVTGAGSRGTSPAGSSSVVLEVGGVGFAVQVTPHHALALRVGTEATIRTALIVREDDLSLFGFADADELTVFDALRGVTGVGPKSALGVLATLTPGEVAAAVLAEDDAAFRKVSGIGPKTAKLIVVSLAGKLAIAPERGGAAATTGSAPDITQSVLVALVGLGWNERAASQALDEAVAGATASERDSVRALLRLALTRLGPAQSTGASS